MCSVTFLPQKVTVSARAGDTLLDAALDNGVPLTHECGGNCACTTCHVLVIEGESVLSEREEAEIDRLRFSSGLMPSSRLACQALLLGGDVTVLISELED